MLVVVFEPFQVGQRGRTGVELFVERLREVLHMLPRTAGLAFAGALLEVRDAQVDLHELLLEAHEVGIGECEFEC